MPDYDSFLFKYEDKEYRFTPALDLKTSILRQIKFWYGLPMGTYVGFTVALSQGDPDAVACAVWASRKLSGEQNVPEPNTMDFAVGAWMEETREDKAEQEDKQEADPLDGRGTSDPTPDSKPTPTNSEPDTSDS